MGISIVVEDSNSINIDRPAIVAEPFGGVHGLANLTESAVVRVLARPDGFAFCIYT